MLWEHDPTGECFHSFLEFSQTPSLFYNSIETRKNSISFFLSVCQFGYRNMTFFVLLTSVSLNWLMGMLEQILLPCVKRRG